MNRLFRLVAAFICLAVLLPLVSPASSIDPSLLAQAETQARDIVQAELAPKVPGLAIAVALDGTMVWSQGFGYADLGAKTPVTSATRFRVGSVSKPLTAAGLALLVERGRIDMDAPVQKYIPDFPQNESALTLRLLAGHLSGIRNYRRAEALSNVHYPNLRSALKIFETDPLESKPGTTFSYSSYNWNVIGVAMESASGEPFLRYMQGNVLGPLDLTNTGPDLAGVTDPRRAQFYEADESGKFVVAPEVDCSLKWPSGGFLSTADDLVRFGSALLRPGFLKAQSLKLLFTSQKTSSGKLTHYGVGWFVGRTILYHRGDSVGGMAALLMIPSSRTVVAILTNRGHLVLRGQIPVGQKSEVDLVSKAQAIGKIFGSLRVNNNQ